MPLRPSAAGHGSQCRDYTGEESDGMNETLCPCDFKSAGEIVDDEINRYLVNPLPTVGPQRSMAAWHDIAQRSTVQGCRLLFPERFFVCLMMEKAARGLGQWGLC